MYAKWSLFTVVIVSCIGALPALASSAPAPEVAQLFTQAVSQLAGAEAVSVEVSMQIELNRQGRSSPFSVWGRIRLQDETNVYLYLKTDRQEIELFQNARDRIIYDKVADTYRTLPPEGDRYALIRSMISGAAAPACAWLADLLAGTVTAPPDTLQVESKTPADGPPLYLLSFKHTGHPMTIQLEQASSRILGFQMDHPEGARITVSLSGWSHEPAPESTFVFVPPASAKALRHEAHSQRRDPLTGKPAPDFSLDLLDGGRMTLSSHRGRDIVVLDFWASWCGPCRMAMPMIEEVMKEFENRPVALYAVNLRETPERARAFLEQAGLEVRVLLDRKGEVAGRYGVTGIPRVVVIGKDGIIKAGFSGMNPAMKQELTQIIRELLAQ